MALSFPEDHETIALGLREDDVWGMSVIPYDARGTSVDGRLAKPLISLRVMVRLELFCCTVLDFVPSVGLRIRQDAGIV